ncbi:hypothetical protein, partial [Rodentibacter sp. Ppn85]|uniref:hypothetical protein n=1 Tax=Rodentibacter sp. Ppn85 TaxID=1908525 RepID=UPI001E5DC56A
IRRYSEAQFKQFFWLWIIALFGVFGFNPEYREIVRDEIEWAISPDMRLIPQYDKLRERRIDLGKNILPMKNIKREC